MYTRKDGTGITKSWEEYALDQTITEFKETVVAVPEVAFNEGEFRKRPSKGFEFATGYNALFGIERYKIGECLFQPAMSVNVILVGAQR